jgi:hypothetical protein
MSDAIHPQILPIVAVIGSIEHPMDASARAHTRANAVANDIDRIAAARLAAANLTTRLWLASRHTAGWVHYCDSVGGIHSEEA